MTLVAYYEPFNGRRPIVERVEACRPFGINIDGCCGAFYREQDYVDPFDPEKLHRTTEYVPDDFAAALTRGSVEQWIRTLRFENGVKVVELCECLLWAESHDEVNAFAQNIADALDIPH